MSSGFPGIARKASYQQEIASHSHPSATSISRILLANGEGPTHGQDWGISEEGLQEGSRPLST